MKHLFLTILLFAFAHQATQAQQITVNDSQTPEQLINALVEGCVEVSNISSPINGTTNGFSSYGFFEQANSNFPFENGIVLSTGNVNSAGNAQNTNALNEGETSWQTDPDLETALGINNTLNATSITFNFISATSSINFNYILASEEYFADYPCNYSDGFAFLIKEAGTNQPYQNIAVIPNTTTPVNTSTIHEEIVGFCDAENESFFEGYNIGDTNFNGRTNVMSASANITPNVEYNIKLIIADQTDRNFDSAVFIEANSFTNSVDLGADFSTCNASTTLNAETNNTQATYEWFLNNSIINGATSSSLNATSSGLYSVLITVPLNGTTCTFEDDINVVLNSIQTFPQLADFTQCDDASNDGVETFNLTTLDSQVEASIPASSYTISYHTSSQDAENNSNSVTTINNSLNPETIYIRAIDNNTGCVYMSSVQLIVNSFPTISEPSNIEICSNSSGDAMLTNSDLEITNNNPNYSVTYHYSQIDADNGANEISSPYTPSNTTEQLFVRVLDTTTGCVAFTNITVEGLESPNINNETQQINACEQDDDGFEIFDLTSVINNVLQGETNVTVTYHVTLEDANSGENPINDPTQFQNTTPDLQTVFIRVDNDNNSCYDIVSVELHTNILETGTNIRNFGACDEAPDDGNATFDLTAITDVIANGLPDITITYYETEEDLLNNTNPIDDSVDYEVLNSFQQLYLLIENPDCNNDTEILLNVNASVTILNNNPVTYCDTDDDTLTSVELSTFDSIVNVGITEPIVSYFETEADANANTNSLPPFYNNTANPFTVYVRVIDGSSGCYDVKPLQIEVLPAPSINSNPEFVICDNDQDGLSIIDLTSINAEINTESTTLISYYPTQNDANNSTNEITNSTNYNTATSTVFAKVENNTTGCYALLPISIIVNTLPNFTTITNYVYCETDGNQIGDFILSDKDAEILNGQTGKEVFYFETENDALNNTNSIDKNSIYNNTSQFQTIYVRVENITDTTCFGTSTFLLEVGSEPIYNAPEDVNVCDDNSNDGFETFNLTEKTQEIIANSTDTLTVTYYLNLEDAQNQTNAITGDTFTNTVNPQQIFASIDNGTFCKGITTFEFNVIQVPIIGNAPDLTACDTDTNGTVVFDLTQVEIDVVAVRQDNTIVNFYANEIDLLAGTNPINNPETYTNISNPQTVYIEVYNTVSNCGASVPFNLIVNLPPEIAPITEYETCDTSDNSFNLNETTLSLIGNQQDIALTFYSTLADAQTSQNPLDTNYNYNSNNDTIYVRAEFTTTNCFSTSAFTLVVNPSPTLNLQDLEACDDDFDSELVFDLSQHSPIIIGTQDANNFIINYFETENDALNNTNAISDLNYNAQNEQTLYVRLENITTACFSTGAFNVYINRKPEVNITNQVVCIDNLPLVVTAETNVASDSYLWSTGETTPVIDITEIGNYWVTVTTAFNCTTTSNFNVTASQQAQVDFDVSPAFQDPHTIIVETQGIGNYIYQLNDNEPQVSNVFNNVPIGVHYITVIDINGCEPTPPKRIFVIDAPQFITPNNDGYFDTWHITGVSQLEGTVVTIYDRYGKLLKILKHNDYGWDGRYNGNLMPASDYWFVADVVNGSEEFQVKGHFSLRL
ncbi:gliding motility-associated-like protein [Lacinutrix venerupis]|uniref:T9SS type B sorting domain-containing protein n=1 Tax=Lacinutrix venerupis TaxID=1486034 RepID=UPI000EB45F52|nr:choice-of-anchor L domain-containing protein [Lacinutrix venerupis]RLJ61133.1 gliding motility-associated-like protein [Lacinutrix venerupis]